MRQKHFCSPQEMHRSRSRTHNQRRVLHRQLACRNSIYNDPRRFEERFLPRVEHLHRNPALVRSIALNEKLASIGGLFGAVNIMITGFLLYCIFTAKQDEKWYYISAVLINTCLLLLLMLAAILFDRYYLKRFGAATASSNHSLNNVNRTINVNSILLPSALHNSFNGGNLLIAELRNDSSSSSSLNLNNRNLNDVPPQYPDYLENSIKVENEHVIHCCDGSNRVSLLSNELPNSFVSLDSIHAPVRSATKVPEQANGKYQLPPNYFDLYPSGEVDQSATKPTSSSLTSSQ